MYSIVIYQYEYLLPNVPVPRTIKRFQFFATCWDMLRIYTSNEIFVFEFPLNFVNYFIVLVYPQNFSVYERRYRSCDKPSLPLVNYGSVPKLASCRWQLSTFTKKMYLHWHEMQIFTEGVYRATTCGHRFTGRCSLIVHFNKYSSGSLDLLYMQRV